MNIRFIILFVLMSLLAGCGGQVPSATGSEEAATETPVESEAQSAQPEAEPVSSAFPVTITHDRGEVTLEKPATRIVIFSEEFIELAIALDIAPVGVGPWRNEPNGKIFNRLPYLDQPIPGEPVYLNGEQPDLEALLALKPDLIIHHDYADDTNAELYDSLLQIAPTLAYEGSTVGGWKRALTGLAQATGQSEQAAAVIDEYEARVTALQAEMAPVAVAAPRVTVLLSGTDFVGVFDERFAIGSLMKTLGFELTTPLGDEMDASGYSNISPEILGEIEADSIMTLRFDNDKAHLIDPILATLPMPTLSIEILPGMGYTGPFAELIYLESFVQAFRTHYGGSDTEAKAVEPAAGTGFPVTIEHKFGSVTILAEPQRVITLGFSEQDAVLALGVKPIAVREWFGEQPHAVWPWAQDELGEATPEVIDMPFGELNFEVLAVMNPDLIVATHSGITAEEYEKLAQIAPTIAQPTDYADFGVPWQEQTRLIGRALGREAQADELIATVEAQIADAANPAFAEATIAWATPAEGPGEFWVTGPDTPPLRFLATLGFLYPTEIAELIGDQSSLKISSERLDLLDTDVLILRAPTQETLDAIITEPIFQQLAVVQEGRAIYFVGDDPIYGALSFSTVLSLPYVVEKLTPYLAAAASK